MVPGVIQLGLRNPGLFDGMFPNIYNEVLSVIPLEPPMTGKKY